MDEVKHIGSLQNPLVKKTLLLKEKSRERKKSGLFVLEGLRELQLALKGNYRIKTVLVQDDLLSREILLSTFEGYSEPYEVISVSKAVYQKLAYRETTEGIMALVEAKSHRLDQLRFKNEEPLILVAESPEKPGNIGALLRSADAANLDAVIIADPKGDLYNPNIIRSSVGCLFTNNIAVASASEVVSFLKEHQIAIYSAALKAAKTYTETDFKIGCAIVVGTESDGLTDLWLDSATENIIIPMQGQIDSMNVSVSAAILIFEAKRQRGF
jgi:TrmH family RNA methyltransferase